MKITGRRIIWRDLAHCTRSQERTALNVSATLTRRRTPHALSCSILSLRPPLFLRPSFSLSARFLLLLTLYLVFSFSSFSYFSPFSFFFFFFLNNPPPPKFSPFPLPAPFPI